MKTETPFHILRRSYHHIVLGAALAVMAIAFGFEYFQYLRHPDQLAFSDMIEDIIFIVISLLFVITVGNYFIIKLEKRVAERTTELEKAQQQILVQEKLAGLGALTAGIAHEIKNPLNFILNFSELSLEYLEELNVKTPQDQELLSLLKQNTLKIKEHTERADTIVKGMLSHARAKPGSFSTFKINNLMEEALDLALLGFKDQEHPFTPKVIKDFDPKAKTFFGSEQDLARVFMNIVNNALYALWEKKEKEGSSFQPEIKVSTKKAPTSVEILIEDNGPGMSKDVLDKIFTPFFTTKDPGRGTGLGLSLSHDIITQQHQGSIKVESEVDQYTRFRMTLPKQKVPKP